MNCEMCGVEIPCVAGYSTVRAKILVDIVKCCNKCEHEDIDSKELYFCCIECLIEFSNKRLSWYVRRLTKGRNNDNM